MAGFFYVPGIFSWIAWIRSWESILASFASFDSIWDSISDPFASI